MPDATHDALREQVARLMYESDSEGAYTWESTRDDWLEAAKPVMALFAERERVLRERIVDARIRKLIAERDEALDALAEMVWQYFIDYDNDELGHSFMSAGERASDVLVKLRPHHWQETGSGLRYIGGQDIDS